MTAAKAREGEEIWETTTDGLIWVSITDDRGRVSERSVGGKAGSRLRIKTIDRIVNEDAAFGGHHPFENGLLVRVDDSTDAPPDALSRADLMLGFSKSGNAFQAFVDKLNELNTRRMADMCTDIDASQSQTAYLQKVIRAKYRVEGDTETYRQLKATP